MLSAIQARLFPSHTTGALGNPVSEPNSYNPLGLSKAFLKPRRAVYYLLFTHHNEGKNHTHEYFQQFGLSKQQDTCLNVLRWLLDRAGFGFVLCLFLNPTTSNNSPIEGNKCYKNKYPFYSMNYMEFFPLCILSSGFLNSYGACFFFLSMLIIRFSIGVIFCEDSEM